MLTRAQYANLWNMHFNPLATVRINPTGCPADFNNFLIREHMFEDYLDIFRGVDTRLNRNVAPIGGWYYNHPFFHPNGNPVIQPPPCIRYLLVAEAAPSGGNNYVYDLNQNGPKQVYFNSIYNAVYNGNGPIVPWTSPLTFLSKRQYLLDIARRGVLLIDLFPFALDYGEVWGGKRRFGIGSKKGAFRLALNNYGITNAFWDDQHNAYSIYSRLDSISHQGLLCCANWDISMIAPPKISEYLVHQLAPIALGGCAGNHGASFKNYLPNPNRCYQGNPLDWQKVAIDTSYNPSAHLISLSF
jgi:hypothetical protein